MPEYRSDLVVHLLQDLDVLVAAIDCGHASQVFRLRMLEPNDGLVRQQDVDAIHMICL